MKKNSKSLLSVFLCLLFVMLCVVPAAGAGDDWGSFRGSADNNAVVDFSLPLPAEAMLAYRFALKDADDWATNISEPLLSGGSLVIAVGDELLILDRQGKAAYRYALASAIGYNCRLALAGELVIVPLADASVQAIRFADGETVWQTEPVVTMDENGAAQYHSIQSAIAFDGESLYIPTVCFDVATYAPVRGELLCVNAQNGEVRWQYDNTDGGYNWNGAAVRDGKVILAGQDGNVSVFDEKTSIYSGRRRQNSADRLRCLCLFFHLLSGNLRRQSLCRRLVGSVFGLVQSCERCLRRHRPGFHDIGEKIGSSR